MSLTLKARESAQTIEEGLAELLSFLGNGADQPFELQAMTERGLDIAVPRTLDEAIELVREKDVRERTQGIFTVLNPTSPAALSRHRSDGAWHRLEKGAGTSSTDIESRRVHLGQHHLSEVDASLVTKAVRVQDQAQKSMRGLRFVQRGIGLKPQRMVRVHFWCDGSLRSQRKSESVAVTTLESGGSIVRSDGAAVPSRLMARMEIRGEHRPLQKVFCNDYIFRIPNYQRPYAWTKQNAQDLLSDIIGFMGDGTGKVADLPPYFLGSIVLAKEELKPEAEVIDGQQRLSS